MTKKTTGSKNVFCPVCDCYHAFEQVWIESNSVIKKADQVYLAFCPGNEITYIFCSSHIRLISNSVIKKKLATTSKEPYSNVKKYQ